MKQDAALTPKVLVVEDEADLRDAIVSFLLLDGIDASPADSLNVADTCLANQHFDVILLDLGLPDGDGLDWLAQREDLDSTGLIITTARGARAQRLSGIRCGADAYFVKPLDLHELSLQVFNLTRRVRPPMPGRWLLRETQWSVITPKGVTVKLTSTETLFLLTLMKSPGEPVDRRTLIDNLGHKSDYYDVRRMEIMVRRLRKKIETQGGEPLPLETIYGRGYAFTGSVGVDYQRK